MFESDKRYQLRTAEEIAYKNTVGQAHMQQQQRQLQQAQQRGQLRAQARYGYKAAKAKLQDMKPPGILSSQPQVNHTRVWVKGHYTRGKNGQPKWVEGHYQYKKTKAKPMQLYNSKDMISTTNLNTSSKKKTGQQLNTKTPKRYVIQNGMAYPIAQPKPKKKNKKEGDFNWKDFGMPSWKDLMK